MQAIIMAAGFGSRIAKITNNAPKSFLEINDEKLINRAIRLFRENNIHDITVVTGYEATLMKSIIDDDIKTVNNPLYFCTNVLASFACAMNELDDDFIFLHADTIFHEDILSGLLKENGFDITLPVDFKQCVEEEMKVTTNDAGFVDRISKEINLDVAEGEFIGLCRVNKSILEPLKSVVVKSLKELRQYNEYFEFALQGLINQNFEVGTISTNEKPWIEIDFPEDFKIAKNLFERT